MTPGMSLSTSSARRSMAGSRLLAPMNSLASSAAPQEEGVGGSPSAGRARPFCGPSATAVRSSQAWASCQVRNCTLSPAILADLRAITHVIVVWTSGFVPARTAQPPRGSCRDSSQLTAFCAGRISFCSLLMPYPSDNAAAAAAWPGTLSGSRQPSAR
jgi:hypothetical protein